MRTQPLKIAVEAISAGSGFGSAAGGMVVYYEGLLRALAQSSSVESLITFAPPWVHDFGIPDAPKIERVPCRALSRKRVARVMYEQLVLPLRAARHRPDVFLATCNVLPLLWRGPSAVVVQSIQYRFFPELYSHARRAYLTSVGRASIQRADSVIAVSEWERDQIITLFDVDPSRVFAVHHGISNRVRAAAKIDGGRMGAPTERPYIAMVSTLYRFKNHARLIEAFATVKREDKIPHDLVIAGGDADTTIGELREVARRCGVADRVRFLGPVHHEKIPGLIAAADVVAYPSLMETFGHPVVEALALGRCVLTSNRGAMKEVAGDAACLVDPEDVSDMAKGLANLILDENLRERLARAGPKQAGRFTWERCAEETLTALRWAVARRMT